VKAFLDTNILVYAFSRDPRAERARALLDVGGTVGVQCLNEFANVALNKLGMNWNEVDAALEEIRILCDIGAPVELDLHQSGLAIARRYGLNIFDSLVVAACLRSGCETLWSEDLQDGLVVEEALIVRNPFRG
jgi:predicted nucleic acid-binding protein